MVDQDMLFRAGLMLAVLFLAGIFGTSIADRMEEDADHSLEDISAALSDIIQTLHESGPGSYAEISFGDERKVDGPLLSFPSKLAEEKYTIEVLPGMVVLEQEGRKLIAAVDDCIVPCCLPDDRQDLNGFLSRMSGRISGGFTIETPNSLILRVPENSDSGEVFIYPVSVTEDKAVGIYSDLVEFIDDPSYLYPGWIGKINVSAVRIRAVEPSIILLSPESDHTVSGQCLIPAYVPSVMDVSEIRLTDIGNITLYKQAVLGSDGYLEIRWGVTNNPGQILP